MTGFTQKLCSKVVLRIAVLATAGIAVSGCTYDVGLGYASDGYGSGYYDCDPYSPFDNYYECDNGYGFSNIGYGGGWYDNYWYPGYGVFLFDTYGRRSAMRGNLRRYWGERRHSWYRENLGRGDGYGRRDRRGGRSYSDGGQGFDQIGWPERNGGRVRYGERAERNRGEGRRGRNDQWRGGTDAGVGAVPVPNLEIVDGLGRGDGSRDGRRRMEPGQGRPGRRGNEGDAIPVPKSDRPTVRQNEDGGEGRGIYRQPPPPSGDESWSVAPRVSLELGAESATSQPAPRRGRDEPERLPD